MSTERKVIMFLLLDYSEPKFVGLAWSNKLDQVIQEHRRTKPPFMVQLVGEFSSLHTAHAAARELTNRFLTNRFGWNKTDYGELDYIPAEQRNKGGYKIENPVQHTQHARYDETRKGHSERVRAVAIKNNYRDRLPYLAGETHPNKLEHNKEKIKKAAQGRRRYYFDDGSWTWCYSKDSPLAYKNRDVGIPSLEEVPVERFSPPQKQKAA